ncbi:prepilin peptidase [Amycolatopsis magusensis]|uniref:prepilin peptidase n=1 Tax=Amycolatopsis magusensis TaxID=882444 RepID=UPI0024A99D6A|nr:A24 family peptidase [Amycolatopsis magusensis]MDI5981483.1 A24 family peptidase [Amycolatopsis magusensis]
MPWFFFPCSVLIGWFAGLAGRWALRRTMPPVQLPDWRAVAVLALLWPVVGWLSASSWWLPVPLAVVTVAVPLSVVDLGERRLPDALTLPAYPLFGAALVWASIEDGPDLLWRALLGALVFGGLHVAIHRVIPHALGAGDVKLTGSLGLVLGAVGWTAMLLAVTVAALVTATLGLLARIRGSPTWDDGIPHGPGLLAATSLVAVFPGL